MRSVSWAATWFAMFALALSGGCSGDEGKESKKDSASGASGPAAKSGEKSTMRMDKPAIFASLILPAGHQGIQAAYVSPNDVAALVIHPRRLAESPLVAEQLKQEPAASVVKSLGVAPNEVEEIVLLMGIDKSQSLVPSISSFRFTHDVDIEDILNKLHSLPKEKAAKPYVKEMIDGKSCYNNDIADAPVAYAANSNTIVFAPRDDIKSVIAGSESKGPLYDRLKKIDAASDLVFVWQADNYSDLAKVVDDNKGKAPPALQEYLDIAKTLREAIFVFDLSGDKLLQIALSHKDAASAAKAADALKDGKQKLGGMWAAFKQSQPDDVKAKFAEALKMGDDLIGSIDVTANGSEVTGSIRRPLGLENAGPWIDELKQSLIRTSSNQSREQGETAQQMLDLRQIGLGCLNYELTHKTFPTTAISKDGRPLLSWRVAILPFIEQEGLYQQFHLDEPWDSPNNAKLLDKMPEVYHTAGRPNDGKTSIMVFAGRDTVFDGDKALSPQDIRDGTSRTILAVEAGPDKAVPWTKPEDLPFDPRNPAADLGEIPPNGFIALFCDGSVRVLPKTIDGETLKGLITPNGGELVDEQKLNGGK